MLKKYLKKSCQTIWKILEKGIIFAAGSLKKWRPKEKEFFEEIT